MNPALSVQDIPPKATKQREVKRSTRRIAVITGTRAEYGLLKSSMRALAAVRGVQLQVVATGMHLLPKFGHTIDQIRADGWLVDATVPMQTGDDGPLDQPGGLARGVHGIAEFLHREETDIAVVLGDRIEAMAGALAAVTTGKLLAHIHGGDLAPGDLDDSLRHAITKLAHLHLTATRRAARRIIRMGEAKERVHVVGAPGLDDLRLMLETMHASQKDFRERGCEKGFSKRISRSQKIATGIKSAVVVQHPCGRPAAYERSVMQQILRAVAEAGLNAICIYPNTDRGSAGIIEAIEGHVEREGRLKARFRAVRSLSREEYLRLLIEANVLIGNSSSGIIEAATAGTPAVNIGSRQQGREVSGKSVIHVDERYASIRSGIARALRLRPAPLSRSVYGDGKAGERIAHLLSRIPLDGSIRRKVNSY